VLPMLYPPEQWEAGPIGPGAHSVASGPWRGEGDIPHYHFDLVNTATIADQGGAELPDDIEAMDSADEMARRILDERPYLRNRHDAILVTIEDSNEICRLPLDVIR
jgi:hypothetical protein